MAEFISNTALLPIRFQTWFQGDLRAPVYRYFLTDLLSNEVLIEIPFTNVSYERVIKGAGKFQGTIPVIPDTDYMDLYNSTMPGRCALYVTRDGLCVWGGVVWTRSYDLVSKNLVVTGSEFPSYLAHRNIWKTWGNEIGATITKSGSTTTATLEYGVSHNFGIGSSVELLFREVDQWQYDGYYDVISWDGLDTLILDAPYLPVGTYPLTTINVRTDTYDFIRSLIDATMVDFIGIRFANDEIEPATGNDFRVLQYSVANNEVTLKAQQPHNALLGHVVEVKNVDSTINGQFLVTEILDAQTLKYDLETPNVSLTSTPIRSASVTNKVIFDYLATLTTNAPHGFEMGDTVVVSGVDDGVSSSYIYDGEYIIVDVPSTTEFSYVTASVIDRPSGAATGTATVSPTITVGTYGPYPINSDVWIEYSTAQFSGERQPPMTYRGFEVRVVGAEIDQYTDTLNSFEYRIDCEYDTEFAIFRRIFYMIPIDFPDPPAPGEVSPISRFGADEYIFTYPGNILDIKVDESSENAATRFFMVGNIPDLGDDASQPYAVAAATDLLSQGWPLIDAVESNNDIWDEAELQKYADRYLAESRPPIADIKLSVNGSMTPVVGSYMPGDWCSIVMDDPFVRMRLASDLEPRDEVLVRKIDGIKVSVPDFPSYPEKVDLTLIAEWQVDTIG